MASEYSPSEEKQLLRVVGQIDPNYQHRLTFLEKDNGSVEFTSGQCLEILLLLQVLMNFSFVPIKGSGWMGRFPNGSYSGMAAQLVYEGADISISQSAMLISMDIMEAISFLQPTSSGHFMALFHQPKASSYRNLMTSVFSNNTLACYAATWIAILLSILILSSFQLKMKICKELDVDFVKESASWAIATACITAWYRHPTSMHLRLATFIGSFLACFGYVAVSAGITVNLVTEPAPIKIDSA